MCVSVRDNNNNINEEIDTSDFWMIVRLETYFESVIENVLKVTIVPWSHNFPRRRAVYLYDSVRMINCYTCDKQSRNYL